MVYSQESSTPLVSLKLTGQPIIAFNRQLEHAFGYLKSVPDVFRVGVQQAIKEGEKKIARDNKRALDEEGLTKELYRFPNGYRFVSLLDEQALIREGKLMKHCVGNSSQEYRKNLIDGKIEIWSLRDCQNKPHCTIEFNAGSREVTQIEGKNNQKIDLEVRLLVFQFLKTRFKSVIHNIAYFACLNANILIQDNELYDLLKLPSNFKVKGSLRLTGTPISYLPDGLEITGILSLDQTRITELPSGLTVGFGGINEGLNLSYTKVRSLPSDLRVAGFLHLSNTCISQLPDSLRIVGGSVSLVNTPITSLPENFVVKGCLFLMNSQICRLPRGLCVYNELNLTDTNISVIPTDLYAGGLVLANTKVSELPDSLHVYGSLDLTHTLIKELPRGLVVDSDLFLSGTSVQQLPDDLIVKGKVWLNEVMVNQFSRTLAIIQISNTEFKIELGALQQAITRALKKRSRLKGNKVSRAYSRGKSSLYQIIEN